MSSWRDRRDKDWNEGPQEAANFVNRIGLGVEDGVMRIRLKQGEGKRDCVNTYIHTIICICIYTYQRETAQPERKYIHIRYKT